MCKMRIEGSIGTFWIDTAKRNWKEKWILNAVGEAPSMDFWEALKERNNDELEEKVTAIEDADSLQDRNETLGAGFLVLGGFSL